MLAENMGNHKIFDKKVGTKHKFNRLGGVLIPDVNK